MNCYLDVLKKYGAFSGRACRTEFWMFALFNFIIYIVLIVMGEVLGIPRQIPANLYSLAVLLPSIAVSARRLHDTDRSGLWLLIAFIPVIGSIVLFIYFVLPSTPGSNSYGPDSTLGYGS